LKITGFSFIRNAIKFDYPIKEALSSLLPLVDEIVVAVGDSEDKTFELVKKIDPKKIRILSTVWNDANRTGGHVLAEQTQIAYNGIDPIYEDEQTPPGMPAFDGERSDWAFYLQGDEVLHEHDYDAILTAAEKYKDDPAVDGLLFKYHHFYGSYDYVGDSRRWYRREIRMLRPPHFRFKPGQRIYSYKDAQGFRKDDNRKLKVKEIAAHIYHYGWVKPPDAQMQKQQTFNKYWHDDAWMRENISSAAQFDYSNIDALARFTGTHPSVMQERIRAKNWQFDFDISRSRYSIKERFSNFIERLTGYRPGEYKNYIKI